MTKPAAVTKGKAPVSQSERGAMDKLANYASGPSNAAASSSSSDLEPVATATPSTPVTPTPSADTPALALSVTAATASLVIPSSATATTEAAKLSKNASKVSLPWTCGGCERVFKSVAGVKYHENNNVCRPLRNTPGHVASGTSSAANAAAGEGGTALDFDGNSPAAASPAVPFVFKCDICNKSYFRSAKALKYHQEKKVCVRRAEKDAKDRVKRGGRGVLMYACEFCSKDDFRSKQALDYHVNNKVCIRPVLHCSKCDKTNFHSRQAFKYHVEKSVCVRKAELHAKSNDVKTYRESMAKKVLARRAAAQAKKEEREKPMVCELCKKSDFKSRGSFKYHEERLVCVPKEERQAINIKRAEEKIAARNAVALAGAASKIAAQAVGVQISAKGKKKALTPELAASLAATEVARGKAGSGTGSSSGTGTGLVDENGRQLYTCELCENSTFKSAKARRYHIDNKVCVRRAERVALGTLRSGPSEILTCELCQKNDFRSRKALQYHTENKVCVRTPLVCSLCEKMDFNSRNAFKYHVEHRVCEKKAEGAEKGEAGEAAAAGGPSSVKKHRVDPAAVISAATKAAGGVPPKAPRPPRFSCDLCGKGDFNSRNAFKYHVEHKVCVRRAEKRALAAAATMTPSAATMTPSSAITPSADSAAKKRRTGPGSAMVERFPDV